MNINRQMNQGHIQAQQQMPQRHHNNLNHHHHYNNNHHPTQQRPVGQNLNSNANRPQNRPSNSINNMANTNQAQQRPSNPQQQQQRPSQQQVNNKPVQQQGQQGANQQQPQQNPVPLPNVLPKGWKKEEIIRTKGITAGLVDVVYVPNEKSELSTPEIVGKKFRTKLELHKQLNEKYDMALLDFKRGKINQVAYRKQKRVKNLAANPTNYLSASKYDNYLYLPNRQTASIFKQSVHYITNNHKNDPAPSAITDFKSANPQANQTLHQNQLAVLNKNLEKPKPIQLFWELRFNNLNAIDSKVIDIDHEIKQDFNLDYLTEFKNFSISNENVLRSVAVSWYLNQNKSLMGQNSKEFLKNPRIFIDREQPLIPITKIVEDDLKLQENKLKDLRKELEMALKEYENIDDLDLDEIEEELVAKGEEVETNEIKEEVENREEMEIVEDCKSEDVKKEKEESDVLECKEEKNQEDHEMNEEVKEQES